MAIERRGLRALSRSGPRFTPWGAFLVVLELAALAAGTTWLIVH